MCGDDVRVGMVYAGEHKMTLSEGFSHLAEQALKYPIEKACKILLETAGNWSDDNSTVILVTAAG